jgi:Zn-dependent protease with chaperone function
MGLPALLLFSGLGAKLRTRLDQLTGERRLLTATLLAGVYAALFIAANLPVAAARQILAEPIGLGASSWGAWAEARAQGAWPLLAGALLLAWVPYWLFARSPRWWPAWAAAILIPLGAALLVAQPLSLDLQPLSDPEARAAVSELAARAGAPEPRTALLRIKGNDPCEGGWGTVKGLGPTKVLVLGSGLLESRPDRQVRNTIAHELKHYLHHDDWKAFGAMVALIVSGIGVLAIGAPWALRFGARRFGFDSLSDPASLPLLALLLTLFSLAGGAAFHRYGALIEREADRFALELTRDNEAAAALMQFDLSCTRLKNPDTSWIHRTFVHHHGSFRARIELARDHRPWLRETSGP